MTTTTTARRIVIEVQGDEAHAANVCESIIGTLHETAHEAKCEGAALRLALSIAYDNGATYEDTIGGEL